MAEGEARDAEERSDVVSRLFYLITAAAEDAAAIAAQNQRGSDLASKRKRAATTLREAGEMIEIIASAIELI